jgi:O-methyltransferase involved in polyketide biosynthesis
MPNSPTRTFQAGRPGEVVHDSNIREVLGRLPTNVMYMPIDFAKQNLRDVLRKAGFRDDCKAFVVWEGVTYLPPEEH